MVQVLFVKVMVYLVSLIRQMDKDLGNIWGIQYVPEGDIQETQAIRSKSPCLIA